MQMVIISSLPDIKSMEESLLKAFNATIVDIVDDSYKHLGHAGSTGGGHYTLFIVSEFFEGISRIRRHQQILELFKDAMPHKIHALSIKALSLSEYNTAPTS